MGAAPAEAFPDTPNPQVNLDHTVATEPFAGSSVSVHDHEGSAYVGQDGSLWLADDSGRKLYEINPYTGALKRTISDQAFIATPRVGGAEQAGYWRDRDLESIAYDGVNDTLYVFSGAAARENNLPTVFRLKRDAAAASSSTPSRRCPPAATSPERPGTRPTGSCTSGSAPTCAPTTTSPTPWARRSRCPTSPGSPACSSPPVATTST